MPLDKVILDHVEDIEDIENEVADDIDKMINNINVDEVIVNPDIALEALAVEVGLLLEEKYYPDVGDKGLQFAADIEKDGEIEVTDSNDPKLNEELLERGETNG